MPSIVKRATPCNNLLQGRLTNSQIAHEFALVGLPLWGAEAGALYRHPEDNVGAGLRAIT
jgi:hypothetical protein